MSKVELAHSVSLVPTFSLITANAHKFIFEHDFSPIKYYFDFIK